MSGYNAKIHFDGPNELVVESGGIISAAGTQAEAIADETAITGGQDPTEAEFNALLVKFNAVLAALRGVGIIASS